MVLSKRERYFAIAAVATLLLLIGDHYVLTPLLARGEVLDTEQQRLITEMESATALFDRRRALYDDWRRMTQGGLATDPADAESRLLHALRKWASDSGLSLGTIRPERKEGAGQLQEIVIQASGTGTMSAVSRFLWFTETTDLPLRIIEMQVGSRKEGADDLSLQIKASTLYLAEGSAGVEGQDERNGE
jgi:Tfp pilus assembly protein PilO